MPVVRAPRLLRFLLVWMATLLVAGGPIAGMAHFIAVPHVLCEHGELVDIAGHEGPVSPVRAGDSPVSSASPGRGTLLPTSHAHCAVAAAGRATATHSGPSIAPASRVPISARVLAPSQRVNPSGAALLGVAPKTSPPAA